MHNKNTTAARSHKWRRKVSAQLPALLISTLLAACSAQTYHAKPIDPLKTAAAYRAHDPHSAEFHEYLITQGYPDNPIQIQQWGLPELTLGALFFHPQLDVGRAQWRAADAAQMTAGQRPNPSLSTNLQHHTNTDGGISPWTFALSIDLPIETSGKRQARIEQASSLSEAARIDIAQTAWQVRSRLTDSWVDYQASIHRASVLQQEADLRADIVAMLQARFNAGMASSIDLGNTRLQWQKAKQLLASEQNHADELRAILASNTGFSVTTFNRLLLASEDIQSLIYRQQNALLETLSSDDLQQAALLNRLDIRASLARYAAAEARLKLEIARQYPDIVLSPGYSYDQGDRLWSLGLSMLFNLLNKNAGLIAEARSLRQVQAAQFLALQAQVISDLEQSKARYQAALNELEQAHAALAAQQARTRQTARQFEQGFADRLELTSTRLENLLAEQNLLDVEYKAERAAYALENVMQRPLSGIAITTESTSTEQAPASPDQAATH